mgnify:CR=1 FL=1
MNISKYRYSTCLRLKIFDIVYNIGLGVTFTLNLNASNIFTIRFHPNIYFFNILILMEKLKLIYQI